MTDPPLAVPSSRLRKQECSPAGSNRRRQQMLLRWAILNRLIGDDDQSSTLDSPPRGTRTSNG